MVCVLMGRLFFSHMHTPIKTCTSVSLSHAHTHTDTSNTHIHLYIYIYIHPHIQIKTHQKELLAVNVDEIVLGGRDQGGHVLLFILLIDDGWLVDFASACVLAGHSLVTRCVGAVSVDRDTAADPSMIHHANLLETHAHHPSNKVQPN